MNNTGLFTWEHRVVRGSKEGCGDFDVQLLYFAEVSYNAEGKPYGYNEPFMCSETEDGLKRLVAQLNEAMSKPVLDYDNDFVKQEETVEDRLNANMTALAGALKKLEIKS